MVQLLTLIFHTMNAEKEKEFIKIIDEAGRFCEVYLNYNPDTVAGYRRAWMKILDFMTIYGLDSLDKKSQIKFWDIFNYSKQGKTRHHSGDTKYVIQRAYRMLVSYYETKSIPERFFDVPDKETFIEPFAAYCNDYLQYLSLKLRRSSITVSAYKHSLHLFLRYLEKEKINEIEKLDIAVILNYIISLTPDTGVTPTLQIGHIRGFMKFLHYIGITENDISAQMPHCKRIVQPKLPSTYSTDEIKKVISSMRRITPIEKRNYAIVLMIARLGIRVSDVAGLKFGNILWKENKIKFFQYKTGSPIELPILADVGNAIIDYLRNGRPISDDAHVFLMERNIVPMNRNAISNVVRKAFQESGIKTKGKHYGPHALRHSLSSRMLENNTSMPIITEVLGHDNAETTKFYLRIDLKSMSNCMLEVLETNSNFYKRMEEEYYVYVQ